MPRLQRKSFTSPDQVREFSLGRIDVVNLDETTIGRFVWEPGWRWSEVVAPIVQTSSCQNRHVGYVISGHLHVVMDDGTELDVAAGDAYEIPAGHDAWVVGDQPWDTVEFASARSFGVRPEAEDERTLATILFTDIVESTATLGRLGDTMWQRMLLEHNDRSRAELDRFRGREVVTTGDGFLALFDAPARAVRCAAAMTDVHPARSASRSAQGCTPARSRSPVGMPTGWPSTPRPGSPPWRDPARSSSRGPRATCWTGRGCVSPIAASMS